MDVLRNSLSCPLVWRRERGIKAADGTGGIVGSPAKQAIAAFAVTPDVWPKAAGRAWARADRPLSNLARSAETDCLSSAPVKFSKVLHDVNGGYAVHLGNLARISKTHAGAARRVCSGESPDDGGQRG